MSEAVLYERVLVFDDEFGEPLWDEEEIDQMVAAGVLAPRPVENTVTIELWEGMGARIVAADKSIAPGQYTLHRVEHPYDQMQDPDARARAANAKCIHVAGCQNTTLCDSVIGKRRPACVYCENPIREGPRFSDDGGCEWHIECEPSTPKKWALPPAPTELGTWQLVAFRGSTSDDWRYEWRSV